MTLGSLNSFNWGIITIEIDEEALKNGICLIKRCGCVLPDGLCFDIPGTDIAPESRTIEDQFVTDSRVDVFIAIPIEQSGSVNCNLNNDKREVEARFRGQFISVSDENTGNNARDVLIAQKNLKILFSGESLNNYIYIKVVELARTAADAFELNESYIPPCLTISANQYLNTLVSNLLNNLSDKSRSLSEKRRQRTTGLLEFGTTDVATFWLLHSVNSFLPLLSHYHKTGTIHPEKLYCVLSQFAGELTTFTVNVQPEGLPEYQHTNLSHTFKELYEKIQLLLETVIPTNYEQIPLEKTDKGYLVGHLFQFDDRSFDSSEFYISISADTPENQLIAEFPNIVKIGALDDIDDLRKQALPGVPVNHTERPPAPLPIKMKFRYFRLDTHGEFWKRIRSAKNIAIDIPDRFPNLKVELMALKE